MPSVANGQLRDANSSTQGHCHNAAPIVAAIDSFHVENGQYPDTLKALTPKHLASVPKLNYLLVQQPIAYGVADGKPYLRISAAVGVFAHFEYDFVAKVWKYYS